MKEILDDQAESPQMVLVIVPGASEVFVPGNNLEMGGRNTVSLVKLNQFSSSFKVISSY